MDADAARRDPAPRAGTCWGVLLGAGAPGPDACDALAGRLDGLVVLDGASRTARLAGLRQGLGGVPPDAEVVVLVDADDLDALGADAVGRLAGSLPGDADALVRCSPVTDALKRVHGDEVVGEVSRDGLCVPHTPQVLRQQALRAALRDARAGSFDDPACLLAELGHRVRLLAPGGVAAGPDEVAR